MYAINASKKCLCGRYKRTEVNFCPDCWQTIPENLRLKYVLCCEDLHKLTLECRKSMMPERKNTDPELGQRIYEARKTGLTWLKIARDNASSYQRVYKRASTYASAKGLPFPI